MSSYTNLVNDRNISVLFLLSDENMSNYSSNLLHVIIVYRNISTNYDVITQQELITSRTQILVILGFCFFILLKYFWETFVAFVFLFFFTSILFLCCFENCLRDNRLFYKYLLSMLLHRKRMNWINCELIVLQFNLNLKAFCFIRNTFCLQFGCFLIICLIGTQMFLNSVCFWRQKIMFCTT